MANHPHHHDANSGHGHHYILPDSKAWKTFGALIVLTAITVGLSYVDLGSINFIVGMIVASIKAFLVASIFMGLKHDDRANTLIFCSGFLFLAIFLGLLAPDIFFRGDVYTEGKSLTLPVKGVSKFKKPWEPTPEILAHGKELYSQNCVSCHGPTGLGDGPAAGSLNPKPRNFTAAEGWKNGRQSAMIFKTLKEGIPGSGMASFATLSAEDRWTISAYVATLGPSVLPNSAGDFTAVGVDPNKEATSDEAPSIPVQRAMQILEQEERDGAKGNVKPGNEGLEGYGRRLESRTFTPTR
jgi:caa(3)-type oxidase subunit IV